MLEPSGGALPILKDSQGRPGHDSFLGFDLPKGTSNEKAREIAKYLNDHLDTVTCTVFK